MNPSILIVEDTHEIQTLLKQLLEPEGYETVQALSAEKAVDILKINTNFSIMLLDYNLPGMTGFDLLSLLPTNKIPVVMITGNPDVEFMKRPVGIVDLVPKPFNFNHLLKSIQTHSLVPNQN